VATERVTEEKARQVAEEAREQEWTSPSFAKELFLGRLRLDLIHPHPRPSDEAKQKGEAFLGKLEGFLRSAVDPLQIEHDAKIPGHVVEGLAELGALGMEIDEEYGGLGLSHLYYCRALTLSSSAHSSIATLLSAHQSIGVPQPLKLFGSEEQKRKFLPGLARDQISAFLLTEPDVGSDPARMSTTAILDGTKLWTTNGPIADLLVVMAAVPKAEGRRGGISAFVVDANSPGITVQRRNDFMGIRGIENGLTRFENVSVPAGNLISGEGRGLKIALATLNTGRLSLPAICTAASKAALNISREWSNQRVQWGKPIGKHEAVAHKVAYIAATTFAIEAVAELSSALADEERNDIRLEAALAKLFCSEMSWLVADEMVQVRGGRGFETAASLKARGERPVPAEQILRDLRITRIFEGSSEIMKLFIAREAVDQHLSVAGALIDPKSNTSAKTRAALKAAGFYSTWFPQLSVGKGQVPGSYSHMRFVERSSRKLARSTFYGMSRWQGKLERKQGFLGRIVDIGAELYAMCATTVRAQMLAQDGVGEGGSAIELADMFCRASRLRVNRLFHELWTNNDAYNYDAAQKVLDGRYEWAEAGVIDLYGEGAMVAAAPKQEAAAKA
jgi:alkylation response protein AidB-like acyl-CoA dehydrogenase